MAWRSEWGRPIDITLYREERSLIWDALHDVRKAKKEEMEQLNPDLERNKVAIRHLAEDIEMIDGIRSKMCVMY